MKTLYYLVLVLSVSFASCDIFTITTKKSSSSPMPITEGERKQTTVEEKKTPPKPVYSFAFVTKEHREPHTEGGSYTHPLVKNHTPPTDKREITYSSSEPKIATVDTGKVTFKKAGTVTITAIKEADGTHGEETATYTLYITMKPRNKDELAKEIDRAMKAHGNRVDLNYIDTSTITDMSDLFSSDEGAGYKLSKFAGNISKWDVSKVTNMGYMFVGARAFNSDISGWNVSSVKDMSHMFQEATKFNKDISGWTVSAVTDMSNMFEDATEFNSDISGWNVSSVKDMSSMFDSATAFNSDISGWTVSKVTDMNSMFSGATEFNSDISRWNVSSVKDMESMFWGATEFNSNISDWNVSSVTTMHGMFWGATKFNSDISGWNVKKVTDMRTMFYGATAFNQNLDAWGSILTEGIEVVNWSFADDMFTGSGLKDSLPNWCENAGDCKRRQTE